MTYQEQLLIIKDIPMKEGDTKVITCPFCYQPKKMSISKIDGKLMWHCYRASCNSKGIYTGKRNLQAAKNYLANQVQRKSIVRKPIPTITTSVKNHLPALAYLKQVNSLEAFKNGYIDVRYAPAEDRVLFFGEEGAVGRNLKSYGAKWISYGSLDEGIAVGRGDTVVLVEDVPSACSLSRINGLVGLALLGTNITTPIKKVLKKYNVKYLILDKDAASKSITLVRKVDRRIKVRLTSRDLKYLSIKQITDVLRNV